ncbi:MAG: VIT1/CCC1 transporter family protein, partial [Burkholderiales bacterium]
EEQRSAYLYRVIADLEAGTARQALFLELAQAAEHQAGLWQAEALKSGVTLSGVYLPDLRTRIVVALVRRFGPRSMRGVLAAMKARGMVLYSKAPLHGVPNAVEDIDTGHAHKGASRAGNLRAAVFGVNDGLVSNASLIMGVTGATADAHFIVLSGIAGMVAGAFSMAAGEYVSVRSQREMYQHQIELEQEELKQYPAEEAAELALIYAARGMPKDEARLLADALIATPKQALDTLAREELGLNPEDLGSPWGAALFSFFAFSGGAAIPLAPYVFAAGPSALPVSIALTALSLFLIGATLSLFTGRGALRGGMRMLAIGAAAGSSTYLIGSVFGSGTA